MIISILNPKITINQDVLGLEPTLALPDWGKPREPGVQLVWQHYLVAHEQSQVQ